jgi:hypothetical protein
MATTSRLVRLARGARIERLTSWSFEIACPQGVTDSKHSTCLRDALLSWSASGRPVVTRPVRPRGARAQRRQQSSRLACRSALAKGPVCAATRFATQSIDCRIAARRNCRQGGVARRRRSARCHNPVLTVRLPLLARCGGTSSRLTHTATPSTYSSNDQFPGPGLGTGSTRERPRLPKPYRRAGRYGAGAVERVGGAVIRRHEPTTRVGTSNESRTGYHRGPLGGAREDTWARRLHGGSIRMVGLVGPEPTRLSAVIGGSPQHAWSNAATPGASYTRRPLARGAVRRAFEYVAPDIADGHT